MKRRIQLPARWTSPITGGVMTTCFCMRWGKFHDGIDLAAPLGTPIHAPGDGVVVKVGPEAGYGETIFIRHDNGDVSFYGHMARVFVHVGEKVKTGQVIAPVGNEGFSTGPHLHFTHPPRRDRRPGDRPQTVVGRARRQGRLSAAAAVARRYSHSMVPGGLDVTSRTTRLTSRTSLVIRVEIFSRTS